MEVIYRKLSDLKTLEDNPRKITRSQLEVLKKSLRDNQEYFEARPIILSDRTGELVVIAGNQRYKASEELGFEKVPTILLSGLTAEKEREIIIRDNVNNGEWDLSILKGWDADELNSWGFYMEDFIETKTKKQTELLSELKFDTPYYEPVNKPSIELSDCIELDKFKVKLSVIEESKLSKKEKDIMRFFAYRFIRIDFENVANYYAFNANDEEKRVMERLRLVLVDGGLNGFIEDGLLRINNCDFD